MHPLPSLHVSNSPATHPAPAWPSEPRKSSLEAEAVAVLAMSRSQLRHTKNCVSVSEVTRDLDQDSDKEVTLVRTHFQAEGA